MLGAIDSEAWNRRYAGQELVWTSAPNRFLVEETATLPPGQALDVACGEGRNAVWLASARGVHARWVIADLLQYTPEPRRFDLVLVFYLQVPADQRRAIVRTVAEAVAPGGMFLLVTHDSSNLEHGHGGPQDPAVLYTASDVVADLDGSGLQIERAETVRRPVDTPDGKRVALDALVRGRRASGRGSGA